MKVVVGEISQTISSKIMKAFDVMRATVKITKISRDAKLKLKFIAQTNSKKLVEAFNK